MPRSHTGISIWLVRRGRLRSVGRGGVDHELEALLGGRKLGNVVLWMCSSNVLLHGAIAFFLVFN